MGMLGIFFPFSLLLQPRRMIRYIIMAVIILHGGLLLTVMMQSTFFPQDKRKEKLVVKTVQLQPKVEKEIKKQASTMTTSLPTPPIASQAPPKPLVEEKAPVKTVNPSPTAPSKSPSKTPSQPKKEKPAVTKTPLKESKKMEVKPAPVQTKAPPNPPKKIEPLQEATWMVKAQASMAKLKSPASSLTPSSTTPLPPLNKLPPLQMNNAEGLMTPGETRYVDELVGRLKLFLKLPEYGDVHLKLTLERTGSISKMEITKANSQLNRTYVERTLSTLSFPSFGKHFEGNPSYTFSIILSNE